jgi:uncharacterized protein YndB with AHSA1/START domain
MIKKIGIGFFIVVLALLGFASTRESKFRYERSGVINAPADQIFPFISNLKMGALWSPYEKIDPLMKKNYIGQDGQVGSAMEFEGNSEAGTGKIEILKIIPNELVQLRLIMTKPFGADNLIDYKLTPEGSGTRFSWTLTGDGNFLGKLLSVFIDCEKMVADQFIIGIGNLKNLIESKQK